MRQLYFVAKFMEVRVNKEIWMAMGAQAWWMHERCMTSEEVVEHAELVKPTAQQLNG